MRIIVMVAFLAFSSAAAHAQEAPHGRLKTPCESCHTTDSWRMRKDAAFDHAATRFPLTGQHRAIACASCHPGLVFAATATTCASCHTDVHIGELGPDCGRCHTTRAWSLPDMRRRHDETRFPLLGPHASTECSSCHNGEPGRRYRGLPLTCIGCHQRDYSDSRNPNHPSARFSTDCAACHRATSRSWASGFDHALTGFALTGAHVRQQCGGCHRSNVYTGMSSQCVSCHQAAFAAATNPNHVSAGFPQACERCHSTSAWRPASFDHALTSFPLTGAHRALACTECHVNNQYTAIPTACSSCHGADFNSAANPNHVQSQFSQNCQQCHTTGAWTPASFDHAATNFALTGSHAGAACVNCHTNGNYQLTYVDCYQCHQAEFQRSTVLNHVSSNLSHQCQPCHTTTAWLPSTFNHDGQFFRIYSGRHAQQWSQCSQCHPTAGALSQFTCLSCHEHDQTAMNQKHAGVNGYIYASPNCYSCHRNV